NELARSGLEGPALRSGALAVLGRHLGADLRQAELVAEGYGTTPAAIGIALADLFAGMRHGRAELPGGQPAPEGGARQEVERLLDDLTSHHAAVRAGLEQRRQAGEANPADLDGLVAEQTRVLAALDALSQKLAENLGRIQDLE